MMMSFALALLSSSTTSLAPVDVESFVPTEAYAVIRAKSLDDMARIFGTIGGAAGAPADASDPSKVMKDMLGIEVRMDLVDRTKPILYCMVASGTASPFIPTCVMHVKDAAGFAASEGLKDSMWKCHTEGDIAVLSQSANAVTAHEPPAFAKDLTKHDIVARVDMVSVMKTWGDEVSGLVDNMESAGQSQEPSAAEAVSNMVDGVHTALEGLSTFEVHLSMKGDEMTVGLEAVAKENSKLANYAVNEPNGLLDLARGVDGDAPFVMLQCFDYASILQTYDKLYSELLEKMPEPQRNQMKAMLGSSRDLYAAMGRSMAASFALDGKGLHGSFCLHPKDAAALPKTYQSMIQGIGNGFEATPLTTLKVGDVDVQQFRMKMNVETIAKSAAPDEAATMPPQSFLESQKAMDALWGKDGMPMSFASRDGRMVGIMGGDEKDLASGLTRFATASTSPRIQRALDAVAHMNPCLAFQADFSKLARGLMELGPKLGADVMNADALDTFTKMSKMPPILIYGGIDGRVWNLTVAADIKKMVGAFDGAPVPQKSGDAMARKVRADIVTIMGALDNYAMNNADKYPDSLEVLITPDLNGNAYLRSKVLPVDPWKRAYLYEQPKTSGTPPRVYTLGADGKIGGTGLDADIDNMTFYTR